MVVHMDTSLYISSADGDDECVHPRSTCRRIVVREYVYNLQRFGSHNHAKQNIQITYMFSRGFVSRGFAELIIMPGIVPRMDIIYPRYAYTGWWKLVG